MWGEWIYCPIVACSLDAYNEDHVKQKLVTFGICETVCDLSLVLLTSCLFLSASLAGVLEELSSFGDVVFLMS